MADYPDASTTGLVVATSAYRRVWRPDRGLQAPSKYPDATADSAAFVFIDETGASTNMVRHYGWGPKGERLVDATPHRHWFTTTFVAGLRSTGVVAPLVLDGPISAYSDEACHAFR